MYFSPADVKKYTAVLIHPVGAANAIANGLASSKNNGTNVPNIRRTTAIKYIDFKLKRRLCDDVRYPFATKQCRKKRFVVVCAALTTPLLRLSFYYHRQRKCWAQQKLERFANVARRLATTRNVRFLPLFLPLAAPR